jgi:hypothetical protein
MRYDFSHNTADEILGLSFVAGIECEVEVSLEVDNGEPHIVVDAIYVDGKNLFLGTPLTKAIAADIASAAEGDVRLTSRAIEDWQNAYGRAA